METGLTKNQILSELSRSPHGKLNEYVDVGVKAAKQEPEFLAHLIAWDHQKGQVRDAKVAIPVVSLKEPSYPDEFIENSLAHLTNLGPREILRAYRFALDLRLPSRMSRIRKTLQCWLREHEAEPAPRWDRLALQHRHTLKEMYALTHTKPGNDRIRAILFEQDEKKNPLETPKGSVFEIVAQLPNMEPKEAAGTIMEWRIPFLIALGALGKKAKDPDLVLALINRMSSTELVTNTKMLERLGMNTNQALKGAYQEGLKKAQKSTKNILKTTRAAEALDNEELKANLRGVQEKQLQSMAVEGNWLVLADKSGSMSQAIEIAREVSATLSKMVKGKVWLVFFDTAPQSIDVTGMPLDVIKNVTRYITANGGTSIGCGLKRMLDSNIEIDGIAVVSDAQENTPPFFYDVYKQYSQKFSKDVPVYLYLCDNNSNYYADRDLRATMKQAGLDLQVFDMSKKADYYSLPNLVQTMRTNRYSLIDEVMAAKLLTFKDVFKHVNFDGKEVRV